MKILQVNCVYNYGSTGKIVATLHDYYQKFGEEAYVCYGRGDVSADRSVKKVSSEMEAYAHSVKSRLFGVDFGYSPLATRKTIDFIHRNNIELVHLHCLNGHFINVYKLIAYLKEKHIPTVLTLHAELMHTAGCEHAFDCMKWQTECYDCSSIHGLISSYFRDDARYCFRRLKQVYEDFDNMIVVGVSEWLTNRACLSAIFNFTDTSFRTVYNGVNTRVFHRYKESLLIDRKDFAKDEEKIVLHVTPNFNHPIKGGQYVLELAKRMPECRFIIVGFNSDANILPPNVVGISHMKNQEELAKFYTMADVTLLTSKRETFSMVCAESLCCGTPIVGFNAGGPESITLPEYSAFVDYGNVDVLYYKVKEQLARVYDHSEIEKVALQKYSMNTMCKGYLNLYKELVQKQ